MYSMGIFLTLNKAGLTSALLFGVLLFIFGGRHGLFFLLVVFLFLVASAFATEFRKKKKILIRVYERERGWRNVVANGAVPLVMAFLYFVGSGHGTAPNDALVIGYVSSVAAVAADKFSSEIGIFDKKVVMLVTLRKAKQGVSGGVSLLGFLAGGFGSFVIGLGLLGFDNFPVLLFIVVLSGFVGDIVDSLFGYFEEKGVGNKYTSNILCSLAGGLMGFLLSALLHVRLIGYM